MVQNIVISKKEMELINDLLNLDGDKIYQKYGYKRDETIIKKYEVALKCNKFMFCDLLILIIIKIKYVMTEDKTPCIALYLIICHNFIGILYTHEYI